MVMTMWWWRWWFGQNRMLMTIPAVRVITHWVELGPSQVSLHRHLARQLFLPIIVTVQKYIANRQDSQNWNTFQLPFIFTLCIFILSSGFSRSLHWNSDQSSLIQHLPSSNLFVQIFFNLTLFYSGGGRFAPTITYLCIGVCVCVYTC